ncbi:hypothetical protein Y1Q_0004165 [Alligator mississippiensis]|uniref:Uncharacterized protein n=1 Tax=Alligator mississippiensis TaxID=8496 RepID=A0A151PIZ1_ALLMI|nr:hypothetical protein Y1Q_0004165 [Alligator mississippiensis]
MKSSVGKRLHATLDSTALQLAPRCCGGTSCPRGREGPWALRFEIASALELAIPLRKEHFIRSKQTKGAKEGGKKRNRDCKFRDNPEDSDS